MSIARIAQQANVSYATAWRIINNHPCSSEEAIAAVKRVMRQMGYEPGSTGASGKRRGRRPKGADGIRTHNIALLHLREGTTFSTSVLARVQKMLGERNLNLIFASVDDPEQLPQAVKSGNVDGILGYGQFPKDAVTPKLERVPAVWMMSRTDTETDVWGDRVRPDHLAIGALAAQHLLKRGHKQIAYINPDRSKPHYQHRLAAFRMAAEAAGTEIQLYAARDPESPLIDHDVEGEADRLVGEWLASGPNRATGLFCPVDRMTLRVYRQLLRKNVQLGRDVDLVSCDNERELLSLMHPEPASIDLNRQTIARLAVERLFWRMRNGMGSPRVVITVSPTLGGDGERAAD